MPEDDSCEGSDRRKRGDGRNGADNKREGSNDRHNRPHLTNLSYYRSCIMAALLCLLLMGCSGMVSHRVAAAQQVADGAGFSLHTVPTRHFVLTVYEHIRDPSQGVHVYIEGDGFSWVTKTQISQNPTPKEPMVLRLAALDPAPNVVYIARPCQYTPLSDDPVCDSKYWAGSRFAPEVVASVNDVLDRYGAKPMTLIGFSGGGAIAALAAAGRPHVASVITLAGNLDIAAFTQYHHVTPMPASLNPVDVAPRLAQTPQLHVSGAQDVIVPSFIARQFKARSGNSTCITLLEKEGVSHYAGWEAVWPEVLKIPVKCH